MATIEPLPFVIGDQAAVIRAVEASDAARILALRVATARETDFLSCCAGEIQNTVEEQAAFIGKKFHSPVDLYVLAEIGGQIAGLGSLDGSSLSRFGHGATLGLAVCREFWNRGVGRALVQCLLRWADSRGIVRIALEVVESNVRAIRLYESLGFEHEGRLRARRKHGDVYLDDHSMSRIREESVSESAAR